MKAIAASIVSVILFVDLASAYQAWGVDGGSRDTIILYPIDTATGIVSFDKVSRSGNSLTGAPVVDLASDPSRYPTLVWAVRTSSTGNELIAVDPYQEQVISYAIIDSSEDIVGIAINPLTGIMYGTSENSLYTIDAFSGESTLIDQTVSPVTAGLGFDESGRLYGVQHAQQGQNPQVVEIDKVDASLTAVTSVVTNSFFVDIAADPQDGVMYGLGPNIYELVTIDLVDGDVTTIGSSLTRPSGLAFTVVPEPTSVVIISTAVFIMVGNRRRSHL